MLAWLAPTLHSDTADEAELPILALADFLHLKRGAK
jgi:hypothetical protein